MKHNVLLALAGGVEVVHCLGLAYYYLFAQLSEALLFRLPFDNIGVLLGLCQCTYMIVWHTLDAWAWLEQW